MKFNLVKTSQTVDGNHVYKTMYKGIFITIASKEMDLYKIFNTCYKIRYEMAFSKEMLEDKTEINGLIREFRNKIILEHEKSTNKI